MRLLIKIVFLFAMVLPVLFSCESNFRDVQRINSVAFSPVGESEDVDLKYTDSGKVKAVMVSKLMLDYTQLEYGFNEFPKGVKITLYDTSGNKTYIEANYGIRYEGTDVMDLRGNVRISTDDGKLLTTEQLYYDQKNEWFYTEQYFKYRDSQGNNLEGPGLDCSKDFKVFNVQRSKGALNQLQE